MSPGATAAPRRVHILGCALSRVDLQEAVRLLGLLLEGGGKHRVACLPVNSVMSARRREDLRAIYNTASLSLPDGLPLVWASRLLGQPIPGRVAGPDLLPAAARMAARRGYSFFLLGGAPGVPERLAAVLTAANPGLRVLGTCAPPMHDRFPARVNDRIIDRVNAARPDILWVGLGAPKQDRWIHENIGRLAVRVAIGVGAAFELCSGGVRRAPGWMRRAGLEWFFRFLMEPRRLFRRYFLEAPPFLPLVLLQWLRQRLGGRDDANSTGG